MENKLKEFEKELGDLFRKCGDLYITDILEAASQIFGEEKLKKVELLNLPIFVKDYFLQHKDRFVSEALQALNDHIGMIEKAHNDLITALKEKGVVG